MVSLPHGVPDVSTIMWQPNSGPLWRSLFARARYLSSSASSGDFEEAFDEPGVASPEKRSRAWWVSVESASMPGNAMKSLLRAAVM